MVSSAVKILGRNEFVEVKEATSFAKATEVKRGKGIGKEGTRHGRQRHRHRQRRQSPSPRLRRLREAKSKSLFPV
jgi:hypothetical protein